MNQVIDLSIVIISYNNSKYIRQCLESAIGQPIHYDFEILIGDDHSTDGTAEICAEYALRYPDLITYFPHEKNGGASKNMYDLLMLARGRYITRLEGDDYFELTDQIDRSILFLDNHSEYIAVSRLTKSLDEKTNEITLPKPIHFLKNTIKYSDYKRSVYMGNHIYRNFFLNSEEDFSIIYKVHPMLFEMALGYLELSRGNVYVTNKAWEVKRYNRIASASNYNTTNSQYKRFDDSCFVFDRLQEYAPDCDFSRKRANCAADTVFTAVADKRTDMVLYVFKHIPPKTRYYTIIELVRQGFIKCWKKIVYKVCK